MTSAPGRAAGGQIRPDAGPRPAPPVPLALLAVVFFTQLGGTGAWAPYLGLYLDRTGRSGAEIGAILGVIPLARLISAPLWAAVADRFRRGERVLQVASTASVLAAGTLLAGGPSWWLAALLLAYATARAPVGPLLDAQVVRALEARGADTRDYGRVRLFGSSGFLAVGFAAGWVADARPDGPLFLAVGTWAVATALTFALPSAPPSAPARLGPALRGLAGHPFFLPFLAAGTLHGAALNAYDTLFAIHVDSLGFSARYTGAALVTGITVEVVLMAFSRQILRRFSPFPLIGAAMAVGAARWALTAAVRDPVLLVAVQALHGISFGAFWIGAVEVLRRRAPDTIRASAQALFMSCAYGIGALLVAGAASALLDGAGTAGLFALCAGASATAAGLMAWAAARDRAVVDGGGSSAVGLDVQGGQAGGQVRR